MIHDVSLYRYNSITQDQYCYNMYNSGFFLAHDKGLGFLKILI